MKKRNMVIFVIFAVSLLFGKSNQKNLVGEWWTQGGKDGAKSIVEVYQKTGKYFGKIVWLREPNNEQDKKKLDIENPKKKLRNREILGLEILKKFSFDSKKNKWINGTIYNPEDGKTYKCLMELLDDNTLKVRGYIGFSLIGKTQIWERK